MATVKSLILAAGTVLFLLPVAAHETQSSDQAIKWKEQREEFAEHLRDKAPEVRELLRNVHQEFDTLRQHGSNRGGAGLGVLLSQEHHGVMVEKVLPDSAAEKAGLQEGDVLLAIDDLTLAHEGAVATVVHHLRELEAGIEVAVTVSRNGEQLDFVVETEPLNRSFQWSWTEENHGPTIYWDRNRVHPPRLLSPGHGTPRIFLDRSQGHGSAMVEDAPVAELNDDLARYFDVDQGVLVLEAATGTELESGDVIVSVGETPIDSVGQMWELLHDFNDPVTIQRRKKEIELTIDETLAGLGMKREVTIQRQPAAEEQRETELEL